MAQSLGTITTNQKMVGVLLVTEDSDPTPNVVALPGGLPQPTDDQPTAATIENVAVVPNTPVPNSQFTFDVVSGAVASNGPVNISVNTHQANGDAGFSWPLTITVVLDPELPGAAAQFLVTPGTIVSK
jgi:hypothetical protein